MSKTRYRYPAIELHGRMIRGEATPEEYADATVASVEESTVPVKRPARPKASPLALVVAITALAIHPVAILAGFPADPWFMWLGSALAGAAVSSWWIWYKVGKIFDALDEQLTEAGQRTDDHQEGIDAMT